MALTKIQKAVCKVIRDIIKDNDGMFTLKGRTYVIVSGKEHTELINKARSYERIEQFCNMKDK